MNVEIGTEVAQFPEKEYINRIFVAGSVYCIYLAQLRPRQAPMTHLCEAKARSRNHTDVSRLRECNYIYCTIDYGKDDFF